MNETQFVCACATARYVARTLTQLYDHVLKDTGLEAPQFALLLTIEKLGPSSQVLLGRRFGMDKTTVSRNVRWLEQRGWVASAVGPTRRERRLALTVAGRRQLAAAKPVWQAAQHTLRAEMSAAEWAAMFRAFDTIAGAAERAKRKRVERMRRRAVAP